MTTYSALLRDREFRALFVSQSGMVLAGSMTSLALATLVDRETGSPLLTAMAMFGPMLANVLGASTAMSLADGHSPRRTLVVLHSLSVAGTLAQALPDLPIVVRFALLVALGLVMSVSAGIRTAVLSEVVGDMAYATARSLLNVTVGAMQIAGFALSALVVSLAGPSTAFLGGAGLVATSTLVLRLGIREHSARPAVRPGLAQTVRTNGWLLRQRDLRPLLICAWIPNGLVVGCEALFVPYAGDRAGLLFAAGAAGMLLGDLTMGRFATASQRAWLGPWVRLQLAVPFLLFALSPGLGLGLALVAVACFGYGGTLTLQERLLALTPLTVRGQVQGVEQAGRMAWQGLGALLAGGLAEVLPIGPTMAVMAAGSAAVTLLMLPAVRRAYRPDLEPLRLDPHPA